jgi:D-alanyl-D-alanine carboxypeptidase (penicillin-binding protein 5/6)
MRKVGWGFAAVVVTASLAAVVLAAGIFTVVQYKRAVPPPSVTMNWVTPQEQPSEASLDWPTVRQSAVTVSGLGRTWETGGQHEVPIASVTKVMTAYLVLKDHPLSGDEQGSSMTVTSAYRPGPGESSVKVTPGESLTERQALEALMLPSADNIARLLAVWDAGSISAFAAKMNDQARAFGMDHTDYTDPSGLDASTMSTAHDQLIIVQKAMRIPVFAGVVAMSSAQFPGGDIKNYNQLTGEDGIIGVKTGSDSAAGACWAFAVRREVSGTERAVYGVVLGAPLGSGTDMAAPAIDDGVALAGDLSRKAVKSVNVLPAGTVVGYITVPWSSVRIPVRTTQTLTGAAVAGAHVSLRTAANVTGGAFAAEQPVGQVTVTGLISGTSSSPVVTNGPSGEPSLRWRVFHS